MADFFAPVRDLFAYIDTLESSVELRGSSYVHPWITVFHVLGMGLFAGTILMMDLRLLGLGNMRTPFSQVQRRLFPWQIFGMAISTITGLLLVFANPMNYATNVIFWTKMLAMVVAALNALAFHFITEYSLAEWDAGQTPPFAAKLAGGLSIALWVNVVVAGRLIPYALTWPITYAHS
jgi:hypothetical protein